MSNPNVEIVDGVLVTSSGFPPPTEEWTDNYQDMGGDGYWGEGGKVIEVLERHGLNGDVKPLFALDAASGNPYSLFELGGTFYFFNAEDESLERITYPQNLAEILGNITDPDAGLGQVSTTNV